MNQRWCVKLFKRNLSILLLVVTINIVFMPLLCKVCKRECQSHELFHVILHEYKVGNNTIKDSFFCTSHWSFDPSWSYYAYRLFINGIFEAFDSTFPLLKCCRLKWNRKALYKAVLLPPNVKLCPFKKHRVSGSTFLPSVGQSKLKRIRLSDLFEQIKFTLSYFKQHCTLQNCHNLSSTTVELIKLSFFLYFL